MNTKRIELSLPIAGIALALSQVPAASAEDLAGRPAIETAQVRSAEPTKGSDTSTLGSRLKTLYPSTRFGDIRETEWPGVFEVVMGANLAYVDDSGRYFLFGHLYDMSTQRDLSAERKDRLSLVDFSMLPLADAMKEVRGNGTRVLAVFSDPDCPYCRKLEDELRGLTDVTIHTFLMPLSSLHPEATRKAVSVWCARNRLGAWQALMLRDVTPPVADCPNPVSRNVALGERLGIHGTPTLISGDGRLLPGAASREEIELWLARSTASAHGPVTGGPIAR
jgi:thiol:disulfide interchange protein DsbC